MNAKLETTTESGARHGVTRYTVGRRIKDGELRAVRVGGRWLVDPDEADRVLGERPDRRRRPAAAA